MLFNELEKYNKQDVYPMHMPGHKRNKKLCKINNPYEYDITEIDPFDDLHHAEGILKESMDKAAKVYGAKRTFFLVNGSTVGIIAAISACTEIGDEVLVARNCHKAVYNTIEIRNLKATYLYPQWIEECMCYGEILVEDLKKKLEKNQQYKAIIITSPTYEGILSDIEKITTLAHKYKIPVILDEAHGAHLGFDSYFPKNSNAYDVDFVIHSIHKTMPSFTQTALLHWNSNLVAEDKIKHYLQIYQSSSPSYLLMGSIDFCIDMIQNNKETLFYNYVKNLKRFYSKCTDLKRLKLLVQNGCCTNYKIIKEPSKIVIIVKDCSISAKELASILLKKYRIQVEMVSQYYVIAMTSIGDTEEGFERLTTALLEIDRNLESREDGKHAICINYNPTAKLSIAEALSRKRQCVDMRQAIGKISGNAIYLYPPGIPIILPGEVISEETVIIISKYLKNNFKVHGLEIENKISILCQGRYK